MSEVKLLSEPTNYAVVHLPGRRFPGVVFQGDSLHILIADLERAANEADPNARADELEAVLDRLRDVRTHYEAVMAREGMERPYRR